MLRGGSNKLGIETGRWRQRREQERWCKVCLCQDVEDERHFLLECCMYVRERVKMFDRIRQECELEYVEDEPRMAAQCINRDRVEKAK